MRPKSKADITAIIIGIVMAVSMITTNQPRSTVSPTGLLTTPRLAAQFTSGNGDFRTYPDGHWYDGWLGGLMGSFAGIWAASFGN